MELKVWTVEPVDEDDRVAFSLVGIQVLCQPLFNGWCIEIENCICYIENVILLVVICQLIDRRDIWSADLFQIAEEFVCDARACITKAVFEIVFQAHIPARQAVKLGIANDWAIRSWQLVEQCLFVDLLFVISDQNNVDRDLLLKRNRIAWLKSAVPIGSAFCRHRSRHKHREHNDNAYQGKEFPIHITSWYIGIFITIGNQTLKESGFACMTGSNESMEFIL